RDPGINPDHIGVVPAGERVECVHKSILGPGEWVVILDGPQYTHHRLRQKRQRSTRRTGGYRPVDRSYRWRTAPDDVAVRRIGGRDPPQIIAVRRKLLAQLQAETSVDVGCRNRVLKIVR